MSETKVYKMRMILGKTPNYDASGKLKNTVVTPKIVGEKELSDLLTDDAYKALGCCEITCIDCYDSGDVKVKFTDRMDEVNKSIKVVKQRTKTKVQVLEEENKKLKDESTSVMKRLKRLEELEEKGSNGGTDDRIKLEAKAKELNVKFSSKIGDVKLLERINEKDKDFKL